MSDHTTHPAPTLEETEASLKNMPTSIATILRRRMGLALVEPEPPQAEPESSARAAIREQLAALAATAAPTINPEARQRLDAEVAEYNRRREACEAERAAKRAAAEKAQQEIADRERAAILESLQRYVVKSNPAAPELPQPQSKQQLTLFPQWGDDRRATAQAVFRSALFPALNNKQSRRYLEQERIASVEGVTVLFTGKQFDQSDLDVYLELLQIARETPFGIECTFTAYGLLKALSRATGNKDHKRLHSEIIRLCAGVVDITDHRVRYFGSLIQGGIKDEITKHYTITINPAFAKFFKTGLWGSLDIQQRRALGRNQTAKALHAYYSTHAAPSPHSYKKLAEIVGLQNTNKRQCKADLIKAHQALKEIGFCSDYEAGVATIKAAVKQTPTQARHIVKKVIKARRQSRTKGTG